MDGNLTFCVGTLFRSINHFECFISRLGGSIIILVSCFSILFNIRYLYWSICHREYRFHHYLYLLSMIFSSFLLILIIVPSVILQWLTCTRLCSLFYCQLEGFISYLNGCVHMFMLMMISIIRYNLILHTNTRKKSIQQYSYISIFICWIFGLIFALPPLFHWNKYIPEGLGYHCGLNWFDQSINSRLYLIFAFLFVYIIPLIVLSIINIYVYHIIHSLLQRTSKQSLLTYHFLEDKQTPSSNNTSHTIHSNKFKSFDHCRTTDPIHIDYLARLNRLKADQRFALATIFLVSEYLLSWTPYACIALLYLFHIQYLIKQPLFITICAFIAKISMIINPFIYVLTIKTNQIKIIFFWKKCLCQNCRVH